MYINHMTEKAGKSHEKWCVCVCTVDGGGPYRNEKYTCIIEPVGPGRAGCRGAQRLLDSFTQLFPQRIASSPLSADLFILLLIIA